MSQNKPSKTDQILDLLLDALLERQKRKETSLAEEEAGEALTEPPVSPVNATRPAAADIHAPAESDDPADPVLHSALHAAAPASQGSPAAEVEVDINSELSAEDAPDGQNGDGRPTIPPKLPSIHLEKMLGRLTVILVALIVLVNLPINRYGTSLARALPDEKALIVRDGLILKGSGPDIYILENNRRRWISSLEAFETLGYRWEQVNEVDDTFLNRFPEGQPVHLLYKCTASPHVYAFENGVKRWIKDIPTFQNQGYLWDDIQLVTCSFLRSLPDGPPIPIDAGEPPQP